MSTSKTKNSNLQTRLMPNRMINRSCANLNKDSGGKVGELPVQHMSVRQVINRQKEQFFRERYSLEFSIQHFGSRSQNVAVKKVS
jgi:hypothetical protein